MYRVDGDGKLLVEYSSRLSDNVVWAVVSRENINDAFLLRIDTIAPVLTFDSSYPDTGAFVGEGQDIENYFDIADNISNVIWKFKYGRGNNVFTFSESDTCDMPMCAGSKTIPALDVSQSYGVRALIILTDGFNTDTIDVSRRIRCSECDAFVTTELRWMPVWATAELDNPGVENVLKDLTDNGSKSLTDTSWSRLFRWAPCEGGDDCVGSWQEYNGGNADDFVFNRGRVFWLKAAKARSVKAIAGATTSLKEDFSIRLRAGNWNDIALPVKFDVKLGDVIEATGPDADKLQFIRWEPDEKSFVHKELYVPGIHGFNDSLTESSLLYETQKVPYSVYVSGDQDIDLKIPPIPPVLSGSNLFRRQKNDDGRWSVRIVSRLADGGYLNTLWCGFTPGSPDMTWYPIRPSFGNIRACFADTKGRLWSHAITHDIESGGIAFDLVYHNSGASSADITFSVDGIQDVPEGMSARVFLPEKGEYAASFDSCTASVNPLTQQHRWVVIGTDSYQKNFISTYAGLSFSFTGIRPNPFVNRVAILYRVPSAGLDELHVSVHDMRGRKVWDRSMSRDLVPGAGRIFWDRRDNKGNAVAAGVYMLRMRVREKGAKQSKDFKVRLMCLE
jgi:hypothetical protein